MKRDLRQNNQALGLQLTTFKNNVGGCATLLGLSAAQVDAKEADADYYNYVLTGGSDGASRPAMEQLAV
jgi:hypothetical protein